MLLKTRMLPDGTTVATPARTSRTPAAPLPRRFRSKVKEFLLGNEKNPLDSRVFHTGSLVAVLAWVGMGADGLSSSCYGPEDAYLALGGHLSLTLPLAFFMALAVFTISASYSQIINLFASGGAGGGYLVASRFLGSTAGVVSGSALIIDYVLTIAISVSSAADACFSILPHELFPYRLDAAIGMLAILFILNLRGLKESIAVMTPIFAVFVITHVAGILYGLTAHGYSTTAIVVQHAQTARDLVSSAGAGATILILMRAFSLGGGTYTGIEAVSNGLAVLREPRAETGRRTMTYMAFSLAFTASGLLLCYLLNDIHQEAGRTLNASLFTSMWGAWSVGGIQVGKSAVAITLLSEALLLVVAAQSGFIGGPQVLASMAADSWVPRRFGNLSDRLVHQDGIVLMAVAAGLVVLFTGANVNLIVVMYSINVFVTFTLSQLGMCRHWLTVRSEGGKWLRTFLINGAGLAMTTWILAFTLAMKLKEGGWATMLMTGGFIAACLLIKQHYREIQVQLKTLDDLQSSLKFRSKNRKNIAKVADGSTAVVMVTGYNGLGVHTLFSILKMFPDRFTNVVFVEVGTIDASRFKGVDSIRALEERVKVDLAKYAELARNLGFHSECRYALNVDRLEALESICDEISGEFKDVCYFVGKLLFERETWTSIFLHSQTSMAIQKKLLFKGHQAIVVPIRIRA